MRVSNDADAGALGPGGSPNALGDQATDEPQNSTRVRQKNIHVTDRGGRRRMSSG